MEPYGIGYVHYDLRNRCKELRLVTKIKSFFSLLNSDFIFKIYQRLGREIKMSIFKWVTPGQQVYFNLPVPLFLAPVA
jgi:hypothetical protein